MRETLRGLVLLTAFSVSVGNTSAGSLHRVWELNLKEKLKESESSRVSLPSVFALRFSPDGRQIAVVMEEYEPRGSEDRRSHLLIIPVRRSSSPIRQFEVDAGIEDSAGNPTWPSLNWTAAGDAIIAGSEVIRLSDRKGCGLSPGNGVSGSPIVLGENLYADSPLIARYLLTDAACQEGAKWKFAADWTVEDISLDRRLVCVSAPDGQRRGPSEEARARLAGEDHEVLVVDPFTGKVLQRWPTKTIRYGDVRFADNGRAICGGTQADIAGRLRAACWDVDTGRKIAEDPAISIGTPIAASVHTTQIVASDYRHVGIPFTDGFNNVLKRRVIWDFGTGKEIASWHPEVQRYDLGMRRVYKEWFAFTISPDGQYIAEGGDGVLRVYRIDP